MRSILRIIHRPHHACLHWLHRCSACKMGWNRSCRSPPATITGWGCNLLYWGAALWEFGIFLCLTGDHSRLGPEPHSRMDIWDLDSIQLIWLLRRMRDDAHFLDQREIKPAPPIFIGAASSPNSSEPRFQVIPRNKKGQCWSAILPDQPDLRCGCI